MIKTKQKPSPPDDPGPTTATPKKKGRPPGRTTGPRRFHLDRRAQQILNLPEAEEGDDDDLLSTREVAAWFACSTQFLEGARMRDDGPPFIHVGPNLVRYRRGDLKKFLQLRTVQSTAEARRRLKVGV